MRGVVAVAERLTLATSTEDAEDSALPDWSIADNRRHKNGDNWNSDTAVLVMALEGHAATVPAVAPGPPQSLTTRPSATVVRLKWAAPEFDGGTPVTSYEYRHAAGDTVPASTAAADWTAVGTKQFARVAGLTNGRQYAFEVRAVNSEGAGPVATTKAVPTAVFCGEPSLMGRRQIWSETLTVEEYRNRNNIVLFYGFRFGPVDREGNEEQVLYGGLTARTFTASNVSYEIRRVEYNLYGAPTLQVAIDKALPEAVWHQEGQLLLHICDQSFDWSDVSSRTTSHDETVLTYIWSDPGLDWEGISQRALRLSVPRSGGGTPIANSDATLNALALSDASDDSDIALSPPFQSGTTSYAASVDNDVDEITIKPTVNESSATIEYLDSTDAEITDADGMKTGQQVSLSEGTNTIKVKVTAEDATTNTYTVVVTRAAASTNAVPTAANKTVTTGVGTAYTFTADDFGFADTDAGATLARVRIVTLPTVGTLELGGTAVTTDQVVTKADIDAGDLIFTPVTGASGAGYASFTFKVNDGTVDSASTYTMTIDVTATTTGITTGRRSPPSPPPPGDVVGYLENPGATSFQSGIGVISGWTCAAEAVEIVLNGEPQEAAYGTARLDTEAVCGDADNGFGLLFNWNLLGDGEHEVVALVDGVELDRATVTVTTLGTEFLRDVTGTCTAADFPTGDETVTLAWQQTQQNFVIVDGPAPAGTNRAGTPGVGYLENPGPNSFQSGIGVLSGWACEGTEVVIELNGEPQPAAYGTERLDTAGDACGDTANGFGLLFNWNLLGEGEHEVVAFVDGEELGRATVRVTTLGVEFVRDVEGECTVEDFPMPGETVTLEWQQNSQNFVITDME